MTTSGINSNDMNPSSIDTKWLDKQIAFLSNVVSFGGRTDWLEYAACRDGRVDFFPVSKKHKFEVVEEADQLEGDPTSKVHKQRKTLRQREIAAQALLVCARCPVKTSCEKDHKHEAFGVWYGTVPAERDTGYHKECKCLSCVSRRVTKYAIRSRRSQDMGNS